MDRYQQMADLQKNWQPPAELAVPGERDIRWTGQGIASAVLAGFLILGGITAGAVLERIGVDQTAEQALLSKAGADIEASVIRLWRANDKEKRPMLTYRYESGGRLYDKSMAAPFAVWKNLAEGSRLPVRYLPVDPSRSQPRDWAEPVTPLWLAILIGLLFAGIGCGLVFVLRRQRGLLRDGRPAPAVVTRISNAGHGKRNVHYEFPLLSGSPVKGKSAPVRHPPEVGATICVLYLPDNPRRNGSYPLALVRLANACSGRPVK